MCIQITDTGVSATFLDKLIISRRNQGYHEWDAQLSKRRNLPATTAINTIALLMIIHYYYYCCSHYYFDISTIEAMQMKGKIRQNIDEGFELC